MPKPPQIADACGRALRRSLPVLAGAAVIALLGGSAWAGYRFVTTSSRFAITEIAVHGNQRLSEDDIRAAAGIRLGDNVFSTQLDGLVRSLRTSPWIAEAEAHRMLPHTIVIDIRERTAAALADLGGLYLIDTTGHAFKRATEDEASGLPVITGLDRTAYAADPERTAHTVCDALAALDRWREVAGRPAIGELHIDPHGALTIHTLDGATAIQVGALDAELATRMKTFDIAWAALTDAERARARAVHLDLRSDNVTVALHED